MKVFHINSVCSEGSTGKIVEDIHNALIARGNISVMAYGRVIHHALEDKCVIKVGNDIEVYMHAIMSRFTDKCGLYSNRGTKKLINQIRAFNPDVIHLHNIHGYYINIKILFEFLKQFDGKLIWTLHDCWAFTGHCAHFDYIGCEKWKTECDACPKTSSYPKSYIDRSKRNYYMKKELFCGVKNMTIAVPSKWLANLVKQSFLGEYDVKVINNGIDTKIFKPTESDFKKIYNLKDKKVVLGVASVWTESKGINDMIKLSRMLDDSYKVVMVGLNDEQCNSIPDKILGIKRTNNAQELAAIYTSADVFVNPTYGDTYPTVNLEAFACGTPCITYATGGSTESVHNQMVVEKGNVEGLYKLIVSDELYLPELKDVDKGYMTEQYINLYKSI